MEQKNLCIPIEHQFDEVICNQEFVQSKAAQLGFAINSHTKGIESYNLYQ